MPGQVRFGIKTRTFNRLFNGPAWGLRKASQQLANMAKSGNIDQLEINEVLGQHTKLTDRLIAVNVGLVGIEQGTSAKDLRQFFKASLYSRRTVSTFNFLGFKTETDFGLDFGSVASAGDLFAHQAKTPAMDYVFKFFSSDALTTVAILGLAVLGGWLGYFKLDVVEPAGNFINEHFPNTIGVSPASDNNTIDSIILFFTGMFLGLLPTTFSQLLLKRGQAKRLALATDRAWNTLEAYRLRQGELRAEGAKKALGRFSSKARETYLAALAPARIEAVAKNKNEAYRILVDHLDTPREFLWHILNDSQTTARLREKAFDRIKAGFDKGQLKYLLDHQDEEIRRHAFDKLKNQMDRSEWILLLMNDDNFIRAIAFDRVANLLSPTELEGIVPGLINVPAALLRTDVFPNAKLAMAKASVTQVDCPELLAIFVREMDKDLTEELFMFLQENLDSPAATVNAIEFEKIAAANMAKVSRAILFEIAKDPFDPLNARIAFDSLVGSGITDFKRLRDAKLDCIALKAFFYDPSSTKEELAQALLDLLPKSDQVKVGSHMEQDEGAYEADHGYCFPVYSEHEVDDYEPAYSKADIDKASTLMHQLEPAKREAVYWELAVLDEALANRLRSHVL